MPLLWLSISLLTGILIAGRLNLPAYFWALVSGLGIILILIEKFLLRSSSRWNKVRSNVPVYPGLLLLVVALGGFRHLIDQPVISENLLAHYNDHGTYTITARVSGTPDNRENAVYIDMTAFEIEDPLASDPLAATRKITGNARVRFTADADYKVGDVLRFTATPTSPSEDERFSYKDYLARQHISTVVYYPRHVSVVDHVRSTYFHAWLESNRQKAYQTIFTIFPQPESSLLSGVLLGLDHDLPDSLKKAYQETGTAHIIAISGFNMGVLAFVFSWIFSRFFNRYFAALFSGLAIIFYTIFVGGSPSVVRAAIMAVSAFGGHLVGRRQSGLNALVFTAALMCLVNPLMLGDVSFQLSFAATLGLVLFADPLSKWSEARLGSLLPERSVRKISSPLSNYLLFTLAAQLLTLPVIAYHFGRISTVSLLANPLILPVQPPLLIMGGISTIVGGMSPLLGKVLSLFVWPLAAYSNFIAGQFSRLNLGSVVVNTQITLFVFVFVILFVLLFIFRSFLTRVFRGKFYWILFFLLIGAVSVGSIILHRPDGKMHINLLRAGEETTLMLYTPSGQVVLFDPGKEINEISAAVSRRLSPWRYQLDQVWLSNSTSARYLAELDERIPVRSVILPPVVYRAGAESKPVTIPSELSPNKLQPGEGVELGGEVMIRVVAESLDSAAILVTYKELKILIPNGVDYALIREKEPTVLDDLSILVLREEDISYIPPRVWQALSPLAVLWNSPAVSPAEGWMSLEQQVEIIIISDGKDLYFGQTP